MAETDVMDQALDEGFQEFFDSEEQQWGENDLDESVLEDREGQEDQEESESSESSESSSSGREGTNEVIQRLQSTDPEAARVVQAMQRRMSQNINEYNGLRSEMTETAGRLQERLDQLEGKGGETGADEKESDGEELPEGVTQENADYFRELAEKLGFVHKDDVERQEKEQASKSYVQSALEQGVEDFGEHFGEKSDEDTVKVNPEITERLRDRMTQLTDEQKGITPRDLYVLEFLPEQVRQLEQELEEARGGSGNSSGSNGRSGRRSGVVRRSGHSKQPVRIYDPESGEASEDVLDKAWLLGKRELTS